jgi:hypothetical protein
LSIASASTASRTLGRAEPAERRRRRDRIGRGEDRAEHERRRPGQADRLVRDAGHRAHRHEHEREGQRDEPARRRAQLLRRRGEARRMQQRRQEHEKHRLRLELDVRQSGDEPDRHAADDEHDRIRDRDEVREADEHRGGEEHRDEKLDVAHGKWILSLDPG